MPLIAAKNKDCFGSCSSSWLTALLFSISDSAPETKDCSFCAGSTDGAGVEDVSPAGEDVRFSDEAEIIKAASCFPRRKNIQPLIHQPARACCQKKGLIHIYFIRISPIILLDIFPSFAGKIFFLNKTLCLFRLFPDKT